MLLRRRHTNDEVIGDDRERPRDVVVEHGPSLAKGPALVAGAILVAFGLAALLKNNDFPAFSASFPDGDVQGTTFLGIEVNGWTAFFSIAAGALLMFGAAQHHLAKLMSLIVGLALAACAVIAIIDGDVLGLAAANGWTELGFAIAAATMLLNALMPRVTRQREVPAATTTAVDRDRDRDIVHDDDAVATPTRRRRFGRPVPAEDQAAAASTAAEPRTTVVDRDPAHDDRARDDLAAEEPRTTRHDADALAADDEPRTTPHHRV